MNDPNYQQVPPPPIYTSQTSTLAIISLIAGILGWLGFLGIGPIIAIITGHMARNEIGRSAGQISGSGMATAGLVLGYINLALSVIVACLVIFFIILGIGSPLICFPFFNQIH